MASEPKYFSFVQEEENNLWQIKNKFKINSSADLESLEADKKFRQVLVKHFNKYFWIRNSYIGSANLQVADFKNRILEANKLSKKQTSENSSLPKEYKLLAKNLSVVANLRDKRKKMMLILIEYMARYLLKISQKTGIPLTELVWYSYKEVQKINLGKLAIQNYSQNNLRIGVLIRGRLEEVSKKDFDQVESIYNRQLKQALGIKGIIANKGKAWGIARVIKEINDINKMQSGEILVTSMTRPEFVPAMKKAVAIITDEGGITCHAAIVSRELNLPCIIGTKNATQVLKDGDRVEVDANKGVVRLI